LEGYFANNHHYFLFLIFLIFLLGKKKKKKSKCVGHIYPPRKAGTSVCLSSVVRTRREIMVMGEEES